ncbi:LpqB family beta-propeller domain-containing protein [Actinopolymorpha sp. B11F2]|uniref:LpqB family beta-propeller domain-containing protein n=1 Tax=Actinopolymorpha sp. B11F2 TaxID=3160862 RepID=UPI0032E3C11A
MTSPSTSPKHTTRRYAATVPAAVLAGLVLVVAFGACARIPSSGPVKYESMGTSEPGETSLPVLVTGPEPGDSAQQVARGFLDSMASYQSGQPVAREYLAPAVSERWQPRGVLVYDSAAVPISEAAPGKIALDVPKLAEVSANGAWAQARPGEKIELDLKMTKVDGEWRIGQPPDAFVMSIFNFDREYERYNLFFFDPDFEILVPDPVYVPLRGHLETLLVNALLGGPSPWLRPAVRSALPDDTRLAAPAVTVDDGVATVDLDRKVLELYDPQRRFLLAQLSWTLGQVSGVRQVRVTVDHVPLGAENAGSRGDATTWSAYDPGVAGSARGAYALADGRVVMLGPDRQVPVAGQLGNGPVRARSIAVGIFGERTAGQPLDPDASSGSDWLATVSADGRRASVHGSAAGTRTVLRGTDIAEPSWDRTGRLWLVDRRAGRSSIVVVDDHDEVSTVVAPGLTGRNVLALKVSREGARVATLVEQDGVTRLLMGRIERGDSIAIRGLREVPVAMTSMSDLAWSDFDQVAVIGSDEESASRPALVSVDGSEVVEHSSGPASRTLAAAPDQPLLLGGEDGHLHLEDKNYLWTDQGVATCPAYPG